MGTSAVGDLHDLTLGPTALGLSHVNLIQHKCT